MRLRDIGGIGEKREKLLEEFGIATAEELVGHFPTGYIEYEAASSPCEMRDGVYYTVRAEVVSAARHLSARSGAPFCKCRLASGGEQFSAIWFNNPYAASRLETGKEYVFSGKAQTERGVCLVNPIFREHNGFAVQPVYSLPPSLTQNVFSALVKRALGVYMPVSVISEEENLPNLQKAYYNIHFPASRAAAEAGRVRIALEELVQLILAVRFVTNRQKRERSLFYGERQLLDGFIRRLPFSPTDSQRAAIDLLYGKLRGGGQLNALLQGDVGSGKTAVAFALMEYAAKSGYQTALMAPTEILARQHFQNAGRMFDPALSVHYLCGGQSAAERREICKDIESGKADIVIGTHAVLSQGVRYKNLSLIVTDEQHRFGVRQRAAFSEKAAQPDVLVMSATPIPRTLALIAYGDLDIITLDQKPAGRQPVITSLVPAAKYQAMLSYIAQAVKGEQLAYFVCPAISGDGEETLRTVESVYQELKAGEFKDVEIAMLHGRMSEEQKREIMEKFAGGFYRALVSTTVIEVGVDVPAAKTMVIFNAERFGLSTLHQLRGRVGRGGGESRCYLLTDTDSKESRERLKFLAASESGFAIADKDFELRGGGDFFGEEQSGFLSPVFRRLKPDGKTVLRAREIADRSMLTEAEFLETGGSYYTNLVKITI